YIVRQLSFEHYIFKDDSGEIKIEIGTEEFIGVTVTPSVKVRITGELDKEWGKTIVDVDHLALIK
ncbi:MAG: NirD/YgiW/YdeI family stress tolerance protein, partial [Psychromonas sp.]